MILFIVIVSVLLAWTNAEGTDEEAPEEPVGTKYGKQPTSSGNKNAYAKPTTTSPPPIKYGTDLPPPNKYTPEPEGANGKYGQPDPQPEVTTRKYGKPDKPQPKRPPGYVQQDPCLWSPAPLPPPRCRVHRLLDGEGCVQYEIKCRKPKDHHNKESGEADNTNGFIKPAPNGNSYERPIKKPITKRPTTTTEMPKYGHNKNSYAKPPPQMVQSTLE